MEKALHDHGGISSAFQYFGNKIFEVMTSSKRSEKEVTEHYPRQGMTFNGNGYTLITPLAG